MYEVFDKLLAGPTWHTNDERDAERFYQLLHHIVKKPAFNADDKARYMCEKIGVGDDAPENFYSDAIGRYRDTALAVKGYLNANGL